MKLPLVPRLVLYFVGLGAVLLAGAGLLSYRSASHSLESAALAEILAVALEKESAVDAWVEARAKDVRRLTATADVVAKTTRLLSATAGSGAAASARWALREELDAYVSPVGAEFTELFVMEPVGGRVLVSTRLEEESKVKFDQPYFERGKNGLHEQAPRRADDAADSEMTIAAPLRGSDGHLVAVLAARPKLASLNLILQRRSGLRLSKDAFLFNAEQFPVTQPRFMQENIVLRRKLDTAAMATGAARNSGAMQAKDYRGVESLIVYRWNNKRQLGLIVKMDEAEVLAPVRELGRSLALISALSLLAVATIALLLARTISDPLRALRRVVRHFEEAAGYDASSPRPRGDEIGRLAIEFERMAARVEHNKTELESGNAALRKEVERRAAAEAALRSANAQVEHMVAHSPAVLYVLHVKDKRAVPLSVNDNMTSLLGFTPAEALRDGWWRAQLHPQDRTAALAGLAQVMRDGASRSEYRLRHKQGGYRWVDDNKRLVRDASGTPTQVVGVWLDITQRKRSEEDLRRSQAALSVAQRIGQIGNWEFDLETQTLTWSREVFRILELDPGRCAASITALRKLIHPEDRPTFDAAYPPLLASRQPYELTHRLLLGGGHIKYVHERGETRFDDAGHPLCTVGTLQDITKRVQTEQSLRTLGEANVVAAAVIDSSAEGVMVIDAALQIESVNPAFEHITGYAAAEVVGRTPKLLFSGRHEQAFFDNLKRRVDTEGHWHGEIWNRRRNGELYPQETSINALRDASGRITRYASVFSDDTIRSLMEARLRELSATDALTGIANRRSFDEALAREWARALRDGRPLSLAIADIDHFKGYNDRHGHPVGDACLQRVAGAFAGAVNRSTDLAARYGGEEFALILPHTDAAAAAGLAERARVRVAALALPHGASATSPYVTISVGVATATPQDGTAAADLLAAADRALYEAKHSGRDRVVAAPALAAA